MVYTLTDHKMMSKNVQNSSGSEWFHWQVLDILWHHFMVYKSIDHRKLPSICFYNSMEKVRVELAIFSLRKRARYI